MSASDRKQLEEMGFAPDRVSWALRVTGNAGLQPAMDHLVEHSEEPVPPESEQAAASNEGEGEVAASEVANSILCTECNKRFRNQAYAQFHAEKSGHTAFEESTESIAPLTEEEKKAKLDEMRANLAEKRAKQAVKDQEEARRNEQIRRKAGQDAGQAREDLEAKQRQKEALQKERERRADIEAKRRVREQIEADKRERAEKARIEKARREGRLDEAATLASGGHAAPGSASRAPAAPAPAKKASSSNEARLRVRLSNGETWTGTLPADAPLAHVEKAILDAGKCPGPRVSLSMTFPRRVFTESEMAQTLRTLGLVPNAALEGHATN